MSFCWILLKIMLDAQRRREICEDKLTDFTYSYYCNDRVIVTLDQFNVPSQQVVDHRKIITILTFTLITLPSTTLKTRYFCLGLVFHYINPFVQNLFSGFWVLLDIWQIAGCRTGLLDVLQFLVRGGLKLRKKKFYLKTNSNIGLAYSKRMEKTLPM